MSSHSDGNVWQTTSALLLPQKLKKRNANTSVEKGLSNNQAMVLLYHYTNVGSYHSIMREGRIEPSSPKSKGQRGQGGRHGRGVYLTDMNPQEFDREDVAKNNYGSGWETNINKTTHHICVEIPDNHHLLDRIMGDWRKWRFLGEITSEMFTGIQGSNAEWDPKVCAMLMGGAAVIGGVVSLAGAYTKYKEKKLKEDERKIAMIEDRQKTEVKVALQMLGSSSSSSSSAVATTTTTTTTNTESFRYMKHVKKDPTPADYVVSACDVGTDLNQYKHLISKIVLTAVSIVTTAACYKFRDHIYFIILFSFSGLHVLSVSCILQSDCNGFDPEILIRNCIDSGDDNLFLQRKKDKADSSSWFQKACSWMANIDTVSNIRYEASVTKASLFGLARIATISFPLARCPMIARKYYWISVLGSEWQAVTLYHYAYLPLCKEEYIRKK